MSKSSKKPEKVKKEPRLINLGEALIVFAVCIAIIAYAALSGHFPTGIAIFFALIICYAYGMIFLHHSWQDLFSSIETTIANVLFGLLFCLSVGFISAAWLASGTIPFLLYWGLELISPNMFLFVAFAVTCIASFFTGQAWTMIPSLGLAFMGISTALNIPPALAAGAIVGGCFLGDAASPICEVPTIASISAGTNDVIGTIKSMIPSKGVGVVVGAIAYFIIGMKFRSDAVTVESAEILQNAVAKGYNLSILTLIPLVVVFILVFKKFNPLGSVTIGALVGVVEAVLLQGENLGDVARMMWSGYVANTGDAPLDTLLTRGGIMDFAGTIILLLFAFAFAGIIKKIGLLEVIMKSLLKIIKSQGMLVAITTLTVLIGVALTTSANVSSLLNGNVYKDTYKKMRLDPINLARTMSMNGSVFNAMLPWSSSGAICYTTLGVLPFLYWPYMFPFWIALVLNIVWAFTGKFTKVLPPEAELAAESMNA